ncbi:MAG: YkgJ family cysteine cluster protein [Candidatus Aenigmarchaeota archaeon]|nr:YkgJ family cysteine cluster protein [Candidatus Aenigmarchaeota archaeon]
MEKFVCKGCGKCCKDFSVSLGQQEEKIIFHLEDTVSMVLWEWEVGRLKSEAARLNIAFSTKPVTFLYDRKSNASIITSWTMCHDICPFLSGNRCIVYDKRPLVCRMFPLVKSGMFDFIFGRDISLPKTVCESNALGSILKDGSINISDYVTVMHEYYGDVFLAAVQFDMIKYYFANMVKELTEKNIISPIVSPKSLAISRYKDSKPIAFFEFLRAAEIETEENIRRKIELFESLEEASEFVKKFK